MTVRVCTVGEVAEGEIKRVELADGRELAVYNLDGEYFATDDLCTHGEAFLSEGEIEDGQVLCPFHMGKFDIRSGEATGAPCSIAIKTYRLVIAGDDILVAD